MLKSFRNLITLVALIAGILLAASNTHQVPLMLWPFSGGLGIPLWIVILGGFSSGLIIGSATMAVSLMQRNFTISRLNKKIKTLKENQNQQEAPPERPRQDLQE